MNPTDFSDDDLSEAREQWNDSTPFDKLGFERDRIGFDAAVTERFIEQSMALPKLVNRARFDAFIANLRNTSLFDARSNDDRQIAEQVICLLREIQIVHQQELISRDAKLFEAFVESVEFAEHIERKREEEKAKYRRRVAV